MARKELIKNYAMSFAFDAFTSCLFREVFIYYWSKNWFGHQNFGQRTKVNGFPFSTGIQYLAGVYTISGFSSCRDVYILPYAVVYLSIIHTTCCYFHLCFCLRCIFHQGTWIIKRMFFVLFVILFSFVLICLLFYCSKDPVTTCWVAEAYEPFLMALNFDKNALDYDIVHESRLQSTDFEVNGMKRSIIGTISIEEHRSLHASGWLSHFGIASNVNFDKVAEPLIHRTLKHAVDLHFHSVEMATTECQFQLREILQKIGFDIKQVYHQYILNNNNFRIMKSQMGIDLSTWTKSKNK